MASRSRIALVYSVRFKRRMTGRPAYGDFWAAASRSAIRPTVNASRVALPGRGIPAGGISPAVSFRATFSHRSGCVLGCLAETPSNDKSPDLELWL